MKKLLACGLILAILSSTGAMCFATEEVEIVDTIPVVSIEVEKETQDEKTAEKEELLSGLEKIKEDSSLTWKEKASRAWEYVKDFVKRHYVAIGTVTVSAALVVLACVFGPKVVESIVSLFKNNEKEIKEEKDVVVARAGEFSLTEKDINYMANYLLKCAIRDLKHRRFEVEEDRSYCIWLRQMEQASLIGDDAKEKMDLLNKDIIELKSYPQNKQKVLDSIDSFIQWLEQKKSEKKEIKAIAKRIIEKQWLITYQKFEDLLNCAAVEWANHIDACALYLPTDNSFYRYTINNLRRDLVFGKYKSEKEAVIKLINKDIAIINSFIDQLGE